MAKKIRNKNEGTTPKGAVPMFTEPVITFAPATIHPYPASDNLSATKDSLTRTYDDLGSTRISP
jgi:hypothetical protein